MGTGWCAEYPWPTTWEGGAGGSSGKSPVWPSVGCDIGGRRGGDVWCAAGLGVHNIPRRAGRGEL